jgi:hypothetical protein
MSKSKIIRTFVFEFSKSKRSFVEKLIAYDALAVSLDLKMWHSVNDGIDVFEFKTRKFNGRLIFKVE